ncbi:hypothetical protein MRX96_010032 [Rhipicephalus microplus]
MLARFDSCSPLNFQEGSGQRPSDTRAAGQSWKRGAPSSPLNARPRGRVCLRSLLAGGCGLLPSSRWTRTVTSHARYAEAFFTCALSLALGRGRTDGVVCETVVVVHEWACGALDQDATGAPLLPRTPRLHLRVVNGGQQRC